MDKSLHKLQRMIGFTDTDLKSNRRGQLSKAQLNMLRMEANEDLKWLLIVPVAVALAIIALLEFTVALPVLLILFAICFGTAGVHFARLHHLKERKVRKITGALKKHPKRNRILIHKEELYIPYIPVAKLPEGTFTAYVLEGSDRVLAMEPHESARKKASATLSSPALRSSAKTTTVKRTAKASEKMAKPTGKAPTASTTLTRSRRTPSS